MLTEDDIRQLIENPGEFLQSWRKTRGLSLEDVATGTRISKSFLWSVERGESSISARRLAGLIQFMDDYGRTVDDWCTWVSWETVKNFARELEHDNIVTCGHSRSAATILNLTRQYRIEHKDDSVLIKNGWRDAMRYHAKKDQPSSSEKGGAR